MKISVLVPSEKYLDTAGVRIRYKRISEPLAELGWTLNLVPIDDAREPLADDSDIYLFSKCQDARSLVFAIAAKRAGIAVGVDLFDDYFSQQSDARFAMQRLWLRSMAAEASFFLCSTERMLDVGNSYFGHGSGHIFGDPHEEFDATRLGQELATKLRKAQRERRISILWFGIANNPNFPVGLHDLSAFGEALRPFHENGYRAELIILTNTKAIDGEALERLRRLPIPFVIREWSKRREEEALSQCLVSFLPVNFQRFSAAKSLNRGISALTGGTQLLTAGFPLYHSLHDFIYDDAVLLINDLEKSKLKLSTEKLHDFSTLISERAGPAAEARSIADFLPGKIETAAIENDHEQQWAVLHGAKSASSMNLLAQRLGWLSLGSPLTKGGMKCDAHLGFFGDDHSLRFRVSQAALEQLPEELRVGALWADKASGKGPSWEVPLDASQSEIPIGAIRQSTDGTPCATAAVNDEIMRHTKAFFIGVFQNLSIVESELDPVRNNLRAVEQV